MKTLWGSKTSKVQEGAAAEGMRRATVRRRLRTARRCAGVGLALLLGRCSVPPRALAAGVVGDGTPGSCTEAALDAALAGGGSVTFNCGASPITITVTSRKVIGSDTSLDGGGLVTLSGGGVTGVVSISQKVTATLANLTITGGVDDGGAVRNSGRKLMVINSTFSNNSATIDAGRDGVGGAISNDGTLAVTNSTFSANSALSGGAIAHRSHSPLTVNNSVFTQNTSSRGGAIMTFRGKLTVTNSRFSGNSAISGDYYFGQGGAVNNAGAFTLTSSTFSNNAADDLGGAINNFGKLTVSNSTFGSNNADIRGGAIFNGGKLTVTNSTFADNSATDGGAAISTGTRKNLTLKNTIVANSTAGENCWGTVTDKGHNLDSGASCGFSSAKGSLSNTDPKLDPAGLADNGGPTQTIAVEADSPAINAGDQRVCKKAPVKNVDQRGFVRPGTGSTNCTIGAYEFNSPGPGVSREAE